MYNFSSEMLLCQHFFEQERSLGFCLRVWRGREERALEGEKYGEIFIFFKRMIN